MGHIFHPDKDPSTGEISPLNGLLHYPPTLGGKEPSVESLNKIVIK